MRRVVLICGPPGAGKTTHAHTLGLTVYDRDDPRWRFDEAAFRQAIAQLRIDPDAQAVVIRAGATISARAAAAAHIGATEVVVIAPPPAVCIERVIQRNRPRPPLRAQIKAVGTWWQRHEPGETPTTAPLPPPPRTSRAW